MRRARRWTWCVLLAALPLLAGGMALAGDDTTELLVLLDPARADIDGDGLVSPGEAITFKELLGILTPEDPVLAQIVIAYGYAMDKGAVSPVDLKFLFETAVTGEEAEEFAVLALPPPCSCMAFTRGDANNSNTVDIADMIYILSFVFQSGSAPVPLDSGDANDDGVIDVADAIYISSYLFSQVEPKPPLPFGPHGGPYFEGLDPTPDALNGSCDLRVANFAEFAPRAGKDINGDNDKEGLWVVEGGIRMEVVGIPETSVFVEALDPSPRLIAVSANNVVYVVHVDSALIMGYQDTDGNGQWENVTSFEVRDGAGTPLPVIDAVLVDRSCSTVSPGDKIHALVTLHNVNGAEYLVISKDSDGDGRVDGLSPVRIQGNMLSSPSGLAVDARTGRIFVSGLAGTLPAVVFYRDVNGDKIVDAGSPQTGVPYFDNAHPSAGGDGAYLSVHYLSEDKTLLVLARNTQATAVSILCVKDPDDDVWAPSEVCRSDYMLLGEQTEPQNTPAFLDGYSYDYSGSHYRHATVFFSDSWTTWELETANPEICCFAGVEVWTMNLPDSALWKANQQQLLLCFARITAMAGDYTTPGQVRPLRQCNTWTDEGLGGTWASRLSTLSKRILECYYSIGATEPLRIVGTKGSPSYSRPWDRPEAGGPALGTATYIWSNGSSASANWWWAETDTAFGVGIDGSVCTDRTAWNYNARHRTIWSFGGQVCLPNRNFSLFRGCQQDLNTDNSLAMEYWEYRGEDSGGGCLSYSGWSGELMPGQVGEPPLVPHGIYHAGYGTNYPLRNVPTVGPNVPFGISVEPTVNVARANGGAGNDEYGDVPLANFGQRSGIAMRVNVRIRCE